MMDRRDFITTCGLAAGGMAIMGSQSATAQEGKRERNFSDAPLRISAPLGWFKGATSEEKLQEMSKWGLGAYEWLRPGGDFNSLRTQADALGMELSCICGAGAIAPGHMVQPEQHDNVVAQFEQECETAKKLNCKHLIGLTGNERTDVSKEEQEKYVIECLKRLAPIAEKNDVILVMEALNTLVNHKGFYLVTTEQTMRILKTVDSPNVKMCFDIYHQQISEGNVIRNIKDNIDWIGHFHVADNPGRKEPGTGELNYTNIFKAIADTGYQHFVALECGHSKDYETTLEATLDCLDWA